MELQPSFRARVSFAAQERYRIIADTLDLEAVPTGTLRWDGALPAVGDWVHARMAGPALALIEEVLPRTTVISRSQPGSGGHNAQVLAANVDLMVLVTSLDRDFNLRRLERYLVLAAASGAAALIALNKAELCADPAACIAAVQTIAPSTPCVTLSAIESTDPLVPFLGSGTLVLLGSSGAGKSTIANALLLGNSRQATAAVRENDSRGRHTTTHRMLFALPGGGALIDTPGLRELGLWADQPALDHAFGDIAALAAQCRYRDCRHAAEPGCAVAEAVASGLIDARRWASYLKLQREVRHLELANDSQTAAEQKRRWKAIHKAMRHHSKYRR